MWSRWLVSNLVILVYQIVLITNLVAVLPIADAGIGPSNPSISNYYQRSQNFKISPKPCTISGIEGTCMFVWECIKSEGQHVGMCVDSFMFGSCCAHNLTENVVLTETFSYTRPTKPAGWPPRPPSPHKPSISGMTTIERPHGAGTLVIRPSNPHHTKPSMVHKPVVNIVSTTTKHPSLTHFQADLETAASVSDGTWSTSPQTTHWQMSTEPNFITKPKPPVWEKPTSHRPKPGKPTKKPIIADRTTQQSVFSSEPTRKPTTTNKPRPQVFYPKPTKTSTTTTSTSTSTTTTTTTTTTTQRPTSHQTLQQVPSLPHISDKLSTTTSTVLAPVKATSPPSMAGLSTNGNPNQVYDQNSIRTLSAARSDCGIPSMFARPETRIVGGKSAPFGRWPWQVSVRRTSFFGFSSTHRCGGALINENWISTAGHCVDDLLISQIRIRVGEYDFSHVQEQLPYIERGVAKKVVHPKYNFFTYEYDLALVKLEQPLEFAPHVSPICLPSTESLLIGMNATVTGWGRLSEGGTLPSVLQEVSVPIVSNDRCKSMFLRAGRQEFIPDIFLCAGYETGGQDSCQGDSGGPLQVKAENGRYFLAGIISWGIGCAEANLPGVCTRISKFVPWIMETVT